MSSANKPAPLTGSRTVTCQTSHLTDFAGLLLPQPLPDTIEHAKFAVIEAVIRTIPAPEGLPSPVPRAAWWLFATNLLFVSLLGWLSRHYRDDRYVTSSVTKARGFLHSCCCWPFHALLAVAQPPVKTDPLPTATGKADPITATSLPQESNGGVPHGSAAEMTPLQRLVASDVVSSDEEEGSNPTSLEEPGLNACTSGSTTTPNDDMRTQPRLKRRRKRLEMSAIPDGIGRSAYRQYRRLLMKLASGLRWHILRAQQFDLLVNGPTKQTLLHGEFGGQKAKLSTRIAAAYVRSARSCHSLISIVLPLSAISVHTLTFAETVQRLCLSVAGVLFGATLMLNAESGLENSTDDWFLLFTFAALPAICTLPLNWLSSFTFRASRYGGGPAYDALLERVDWVDERTLGCRLAVMRCFRALRYVLEDFTGIVLEKCFGIKRPIRVEPEPLPDDELDSPLAEQGMGWRDAVRGVQVGKSFGSSGRKKGLSSGALARVRAAAATVTSTQVVKTLNFDSEMSSSSVLVQGPSNSEAQDTVKELLHHHESNAHTDDIPETQAYAAAIENSLRVPGYQQVGSDKVGAHVDASGSSTSREVHHRMTEQKLASSPESESGVEAPEPRPDLERGPEPVVALAPGPADEGDHASPPASPPSFPSTSSLAMRGNATLAAIPRNGALTVIPGSAAVAQIRKMASLDNAAAPISLATPADLDDSKAAARADIKAVDKQTAAEHMKAKAAIRVRNVQQARLAYKEKRYAPAASGSAANILGDYSRPTPAERGHSQPQNTGLRLEGLRRWKMPDFRIAAAPLPIQTEMPPPRDDVHDDLDSNASEYELDMFGGKKRKSRLDRKRSRRLKRGGDKLELPSGATLRARDRGIPPFCPSRYALTAWVFNIVLVFALTAVTSTVASSSARVFEPYGHRPLQIWAAGLGWLLLVVEPVSFMLLLCWDLRPTWKNMYEIKFAAIEFVDSIPLRLKNLRHRIQLRLGCY